MKNKNLLILFSLILYILILFIPISCESPGATAYSVTMQTEGSGSATAIPNLTASGTLITIIAEEDFGFEFMEWQVISGGITLSSTTARKATFIMPGRDVIIKAVFEVAASPPPLAGFEWIRPGTFTMGSSDSVNDLNAQPSHKVKLTKGFYMGKYEVTQEQWETVMTGNTNGIDIKPSYFTTANGEPPVTGEVEKKRPVENVSWYDVLVFCNRLSMAEGLDSVYSISDSTDLVDWGTAPTSISLTWNEVEMVSGANGYRLPTEAEWEYACRAGTTTAYNTGSDSISDNTGWYSGNSSMTHEVGKKAANGWDLYDMHGNVREWCWDRYNSTYYANSPPTDPKGAVTGAIHVGRGGSYFDPESGLRSAYRSVNNPQMKAPTVGFRLVRSL